MKFSDLVNRVQEGKSIGSMRGGLPDAPSTLSQKGSANPNIKKSTAKGFKVVQANYRRKLADLVDDFQKGKRNLKQVEKESLDVIQEYFSKAFRYGLMNQAGILSTPENFPLQQAHYQWLNKASREEFGYFAEFLDDVKKKKLKMHWLARVDMYVNTLESVFFAGIAAATPKKDAYVIFHWELSDAEHCDGCVYLAELSPFTREALPSTPRDGATQCFSNCKCDLRPQKVTKEEYDEIAKNLPQRKNIVAQLKRIKERKAGTRRK